MPGQMTLRRALAITAVAGFVAGAIATMAAPAEPWTFRGVIDGDTLRGEPHNLRLTRRGDRPFDTPEIRNAECREERRLGIAASRRLFHLLEGAHLTIIGGPGAGGWDRGLAFVTLPDGRDAGDVLIAEGLAKPGMNADWC